MKTIVNYIHELALMKRRLVSGFDRLVEQNRYNLASHAYRASMIGMIIAQKEKADEAKVALMLLIHENGETRVGDPDFIAKKYGLKDGDGEEQAFKDQIKGLAPTTQRLFISLFNEKKQRESLEAKVACDADILEHAFSGKEFLDQGVKGAKKWIDDIEPLLRTKTAKKMFKALKTSDSNEWWQGLDT